MERSEIKSGVTNVLIAVARPEVTARHVQPPIESMTCAAVLMHRGFAVTVHDDRIGDVLPGTAYELVVLVTQTYDRAQCYSLSLTNARFLADRLREQYPAAAIVAAGVHGDIEPGITSASLGLPCLPGEIEASVPWLAQLLAEKDGRLDAVDLQKAPRQVIPNDLPTPAYESVDMSAYVGEIVDEATHQVYFGRAGLVFANRGCPYTCSYCFVWFGHKLRIRDPRKVLADVLAQRAGGTRHFFFLDYTFTFDRAWTLEVSELLRVHAPDVTWVCQTRCENVDAEILSAMRAGGCVGVFYGIETPWIATTTMRKRTRRDVIDKALEETVAAGLHPFVFVLLGLEGYNSQRRDELVNWLRDLPATFSARALLPRPHTRLFTVPADEPAKSWPELEQESVRLGNEYWPPELDDLQRQLLALPNNVLNAPHERAAA